MLAIVSAVAFGLTAGGILGVLVTGDPRYSIFWGVSLAVGILAGMGSLFSTSTRIMAKANDPVTGELALARIERIRRTGMTVNDQPQCELVLTVAPRHRGAYTTVHREVVDLVALPRLQPGSIVVVRRPSPEKANVLLVMEPPAEWERLREAERLRSGADRTVPIASATTAWASEPETLLGVPKPAARPGRTAMLTAVFAIAAAAALAPAYNTIGRMASAIAAGDPAAAGVVEGTRHAEIVEALAREVGSTEFVSVAFYDGYALATAPSTPGALTIDDYQYRYDRTEHRGPELIQPEDPAGSLFDVSSVDFGDVRGLIARAKAQSGIAEPDSVIVIFERTMAADESGARPVQAMVLLDSPYEDASVRFDAATGELLA
jgi:hypothetical protein